MSSFFCGERAAEEDIREAAEALRIPRDEAARAPPAARGFSRPSSARRRAHSPAPAAPEFMSSTPGRRSRKRSVSSGKCVQPRISASTPALMKGAAASSTARASSASPAEMRPASMSGTSAELPRGKTSTPGLAASSARGKAPVRAVASVERTPIRPVTLALAAASAAGAITPRPRPGRPARLGEAGGGYGAAGDEQELYLRALRQAAGAVHG